MWACTGVVHVCAGDKGCTKTGAACGVREPDLAVRPRLQNATYLFRFRAIVSLHRTSGQIGGKGSRVSRLYGAESLCVSVDQKCGLCNSNRHVRHAMRWALLA